MAQAAKLPSRVVQDREVEAVVGWDWEERGTEELRTAVFEKTLADVIFEMQVPHAAGEAFGPKGAEVRVRARLIGKNGKPRMSGDCSGQAFNAVSPPENVVRHCALRILGKGLERNMN